MVNFCAKFETTSAKPSRRVLNLRWLASSVKSSANFSRLPSETRKVVRAIQEAVGRWWADELSLRLYDLTVIDVVCCRMLSMLCCPWLNQHAGRSIQSNKADCRAAKSAGPIRNAFQVSPGILRHQCTHASKIRTAHRRSPFPHPEFESESHLEGSSAAPKGSSKDLSRRKILCSKMLTTSAIYQLPI